MLRYLTVFIMCFPFLIFGSAELCAEEAKDGRNPIFAHGETVDIAFRTNGITLSGIFDVPAVDQAKALIIIVHSYGETNVRNWYSYSKERQFFNNLGIATVLWDKPGLGESEGVFDINQSVHESGQEVVDAARYLRSIGAPGSQKIGLWGGSRAGWIAPIALSKDTDLSFWISISGTSEEDNFTYQLLANLPYEGGTEEEVTLFSKEWREGCKIFRTRGSFEAFQNATKNLRANEYISRKRGGWPTRAAYKADQRNCKDGTCPNIYPDMCQYISVKNFPQMLSALDINVLALLGEKDLHVDWRRTKDLYTRTIGKNPNASLTLYTFSDADHGLDIAETGSLKEMRTRTKKQKTARYYEVQKQWLQDHVLR